MKILAVDSTAKVASVALCDGDKPVAHHFLNTALTHSQTLLVMVDQMMQNAGWNNQDIELFAVSNGPGSFTGVRIGVSLIKGIAFDIGRPCVGVSTLAALTYNMEGLDGIFCPVMDARNHQVYNALFDMQGGKINRLCNDRAIAIDKLLKELQDFDAPVWLLGDGAELCYQAIGDAGKDIRLANYTLRYQNALCVARAGYVQYLRGEYVNDSQLDVFYLRPSQAEREYQQKQKQKEENGGIVK